MVKVLQICMLNIGLGVQMCTSMSVFSLVANYEISYDNLCKIRPGFLEGGLHV